MALPAAMAVGVAASCDCGGDVVFDGLNLISYNSFWWQNNPPTLPLAGGE